jgi:hypothetical protein
METKSLLDLFLQEEVVDLPRIDTIWKVDHED